MFICSIKTDKKTIQWVLSGVAVLVVVALGAWWLSSAVSATAAVTYSAANEDERLALLTGWGLETDGTPQVREIRLPDEADAVFTQYNALQQKADMDLSPYLGKRVKVYSYQILNHAAGEAVANVYVYRGKIVGGDITPLADAASAAPLC